VDLIQSEDKYIEGRRREEGDLDAEIARINAALPGIAMREATRNQPSSPTRPMQTGDPTNKGVSDPNWTFEEYSDEAR
jgi:hypothetical protein